MRWALRHLILLLLAFLFSASAVGEDVLSIDFGEGWEIGYEDENENGFTIEFVPIGQSTEDWTHLLTIQGFRIRHKLHEVFLRFRVDGEERRMRARCRNKTWWTVLWEKDDRVIYHWRTYNCPNQDDQAAVAAYITGETKLFRVAFTKKTPRILTLAEKRWWDRVLLDAEVEQSP